MWNKFIGTIAVSFSVLIFIGFMSLVGNPHVNETAMGLIISVLLGLFIFFKFGKHDRRNLL